MKIMIYYDIQYIATAKIQVGRVYYVSTECTEITKLLSPAFHVKPSNIYVFLLNETMNWQSRAFMYFPVLRPISSQLVTRWFLKSCASSTCKMFIYRVSYGTIPSILVFWFNCNVECALTRNIKRTRAVLFCIFALIPRYIYLSVILQRSYFI